jgi:hypothetical protein
VREARLPVAEVFPMAQSNPQSERADVYARIRDRSRRAQAARICARTAVAREFRLVEWMSS